MSLSKLVDKTKQVQSGHWADNNPLYWRCLLLCYMVELLVHECVCGLIRGSMTMDNPCFEKQIIEQSEIILFIPMVMTDSSNYNVSSRTILVSIAHSLTSVHASRCLGNDQKLVTNPSEAQRSLKRSIHHLCQWLYHASSHLTGSASQAPVNHMNKYIAELRCAENCACKVQYTLWVGIFTFALWIIGFDWPKLSYS